ncbi:hypothetical protein EYC80_002253 [Monilinia laxa]|uniref:Uncharacterized protein n=1 Tax=Monilinia laxa TaxID=61186 RepID=A0A5N6K3F5_MONLA|nr:hypothetical protein EYC80_002253 [Monilinia laxa]
MAGDTSNEELIFVQYLQDHSHIPTTEWWNEAKVAFQTLMDLLNLRSAGPDSDPESQEGDIPSARLARLGALPKLICFATGGHALGLTARHETLECVVFGTISASLFVEVFWKLIQKSQDENPEENIIVSSVLPRWSSKQAIRLLWLTDFAQSLGIGNTLPFAYHYIRSWATLQGLYGRFNIGGLTFIAIIVLLRDALSTNQCGNGFFDDDGDKYLTEDPLTQWTNIYQFYHLQNVDQSSFELMHTKFNLTNSIIKSGPEEELQNVLYRHNRLAHIKQQSLSQGMDIRNIVEINLVYSIPALHP